MKLDPYTITRYPAAVVLISKLEQHDEKIRKIVFRFLTTSFLVLKEYQSLSPKVRIKTLKMFKKEINEWVKNNETIPLELKSYTTSVIVSRCREEHKIALEEMGGMNQVLVKRGRIYNFQEQQPLEYFQDNIDKIVKKINESTFRGSFKSSAKVLQILEHPVTKRPAYKLEGIRDFIECYKCIVA